MGGGWQCKPLWFRGLIRVVVTQILRQTIDKASCRISFNKAMIPIEKSGHGLLFFHVPLFLIHQDKVRRCESVGSDTLKNRATGR